MQLWSKDQEDLFKTNYPILPASELLKMFPFSKAQLKRKALGLKLSKKGKLSTWRYEDEQTLIREYPNKSNAELAQQFNRTRFTIGSAAHVLRLRKTAEFMTARSSATQFKKGNVAINKGKKQHEYMSAHAIERTKSTRFKKGDIPGNCYNEIGKVVVRLDKRRIPYQFICLAINKWIPLHKHIWEKENGIQPAKHVIIFKDGNTMNAEISNLELITRAENMIRNSDHENPSDNRIAYYLTAKNRSVNMHLKKELLKHPELLELKRVQLKLQKELKNENI